jgi:hypothetical protein
MANRNGSPEETRCPEVRRKYPEIPEPVDTETVTEQSSARPEGTGKTETREDHQTSPEENRRARRLTVCSPGWLYAGRRIPQGEL